WTTFTPPAAAPCRRFRGLISHCRSHRIDLTQRKDIRMLVNECLDVVFKKGSLRKDCRQASVGWNIGWFDLLAGHKPVLVKMGCTTK
ncbi:hypothetical protein, partial [Paracoccus sp. SSK6]|uniref:hypothetical protein n=1 Tax=Paracoccus sp. SSK6 TaxID=3143131 RepID=UPI003219D7D7